MITVDKGDILGVILMIIPASLGALVVGLVMLSCLVNGRPSAPEWIPPLIILAVLSLVGWGLWEVAHWFTR